MAKQSNKTSKTSSSKDNIIELSLLELESTILNASTQAIVATTSYEAALQNAIDIICNTTGWDVGHVYARDIFGHDEMISMPIWHIKNEAKHASFRAATEHIMNFEIGMGLPGEVLETGKPAWLQNIQEDAHSPRKKLCKDMAVKGAFAFPVKDEHKIIAVLEFFSVYEMQVEEEFIHRMRSIGAHIGALLGRKHLEKSLKDQKYALDMSALVSQTDVNGSIIYTNDAFNNLFQYSSEQLIGKDHSLLSSGLHPKTLYKELWNAIQQGEVWSGEIKNRSNDGAYHWLSITIVPLLDVKQQPYQYLAISFDITARKKAEEKIQYLAYYDYLTNLPNRVLFKEHLEQAILHCKRTQSSLGIIFLDLDNFKRINDSFGHEGGDKLLQLAARRLSKCLRNSDYLGRRNKCGKTPLARLGGDEFTVLISNNADQSTVAKVARRIIEHFAEPFHVNTKEILVSTSIGIAMFPEDGHDVDTLLRNADSAMYYAKEKGKNNFQFYSRSMNESAKQKLVLETQLRRSLQQPDTFVLHYQPQIDIRSGNIIGTEALIRWNHPELGLVYPGDFIPLSEESTLITSIGEWAMQRACEDNRQWHQQGFSHLKVAVNLSVRQFTESLLDVTEEILKKTQLAPEHLELEVTEGMIMMADSSTIDILTGLKKIGVTISVDDFGTGYSSLRYLSEFPLDIIKIDASFIKNVTTNRSDAIITQSIIALAHGLNMKVIAEGVETQQQFDFLLEHNCDYAQGYLLSRPIDADNLLMFLKNK